jgi:hypothetical protein
MFRCCLRIPCVGFVSRAVTPLPVEAARIKRLFEEFAMVTSDSHAVNIAPQQGALRNLAVPRECPEGRPNDPPSLVPQHSEHTLTESPPASGSG